MIIGTMILLSISPLRYRVHYNIVSALYGFLGLEILILWVESLLRIICGTYLDITLQVIRAIVLSYWNVIIYDETAHGTMLNLSELKFGKMDSYNDHPLSCDFSTVYI